MKKRKFFKVTAKCGHVGRRNYVPILFAVKAFNGKEAAKEVKKVPRVKRHHKDAILDVEEIEKEQYDAINNLNNKDPYLKCQNIQEQRLITGFDKRIKPEKQIKNEYNNPNRYERVQYKLKKYKEIDDSLRRELNEYIYQFN